MGGANGLIVAFVVAVWAAYFVPLVLRRYDEASADSSLEDLSPLSRVIRRRSGDDSAETDVDPDAISGADADNGADSSEARVPTPQVARSTSAPRPVVTRRAAAIAARRRRRTLITLLTALAVVAALAAFSVVAPVWVAVPVALVVAWLVACRVQVRAERGITSSVTLPKVSRPRRSAPARPRSVDEEPTVVVSGQVEDVDPGRRHVMQEADLAEDALDEKIQIAVPSVSTTGEALWDPLPVTLPTYVTKPRVGRTVRTIDFTAADAWTSGHVEGEDVELPGRTRPAADTPDQPRRASGE